MLRLDNLLLRRSTSEASPSDSGSVSTSNVLWCFPALGPRSTMGRHAIQQLVAVTFVGDALVVFLALCLTFLVRFHSPIRELGFQITPNLVDYSGYIILATVLLVALMAFGGIYKHRDLLRLRLITARITQWSFCWVSLVLLGTFMLKFEPPVSRVFCMMAWVAAPVSLIGWRIVFHLLITRTAVITALRQRVAFVGWNDQTTRLAASFQDDPQSAYQVVGYFQNGNGRTSQQGNIPCIGTMDKFECVLASTPIEVVVLADHDCDRSEILRLAHTCEREMVDFKVVPTYFQILLSGLQLETIAGIPILGISRLPLDRIVNRVIKRLVDVIGGTVGLLISVPIITVFGALVYAESPGPIFYRQRRLGRDGKRFDIVKLRSMRLDAEKNNQVGWTVQNDPRRLKIGAFMRTWNVDEVPQFWNVLKGEMSLVGPRPERPELIDAFKHQIPHYNARHSAKPGITGWAQVNGLRGDTNLTQRVEYDLWYMENWSVVLDFQIMLMTVLRPRNGA